MIDAWSGLADLLANMIEKYASELELDELPNPEPKNKSADTRKNADRT